MNLSKSSTNVTGNIESGVDLHYADDREPGIRRKRQRNGFSYWDANGKRMTDADEIQRINRLAIPPNYEEVWISPDPLGHIQATARDARGRKQYRYHALWRSSRDANKFDRMLAFGLTLPVIRARIDEDLLRPGLTREKLIATVMRLLETTLIRVGNEEYARTNNSFGLTTLRNRHVEVKGNAIRFHFRGKSGVEHQVRVNDARLASIVRRCLDIPGQELFQYLDEDGQRHRIGSSDVNDYLRAFGDGQFTAKDYRTWAGSVFAMHLLLTRPFATALEARSNVVATIREVAAVLGNTPAVCRRCYVHPDVLNAYQQNNLPLLKKDSETGLAAAEARLLTFLRKEIKKKKSPL